jgi:hypothetical protein
MARFENFRNIRIHNLNLWKKVLCYIYPHNAILYEDSGVSRFMKCNVQKNLKKI